MKKLTMFGLCMLLPALLYGAFEDMETGARATAMGGAFVAQGDDVSTIFYNPAGLAGIQGYALSASYENLFFGLTDNSSIGRNVVAFGMPVNFRGRYWGNAGIGWNRLSLSGLYDEGALTFSYAYPVQQDVWVGVNINRMSVSYGSDEYTKINPVFAAGSQKSSMGIDLGLQKRIDDLTLGLSLQNINEPDLGLKFANKVGRKISAGFTLQREVSAWSGAIVLANKDIRFKTGAEIALLQKLLKDRFVARGGFSIGSRDYRNLALGFGYHASGYRVDYAFVYPLSGLSETWGSHLVSVAFGWGRPPAPKEETSYIDMTLKELLNQKLPAPQEGISAGGALEEPVSEPPKEMSPEERKRARELIDNGRQRIETGFYAEAQARLQEADNLFKSYIVSLSVDQMVKMPDSDDILKTDQEAKDLIAQLTPVVNVSTGIITDDRQGVLLRKAVNKYMNRDADAVNMITFAYQQWPQDAVTLGLRDVVMKSFPDESSRLKLLPGITIVDQMLQDALDLIRGGRFIQAVAVLEKALDIDPENITGLTRMGSAYWAMGKKDMARVYWRKVLQLDPRNREVSEFLRGY